MLSSLFGRSALTWLGVFAVQHTVMARPAFKRWWTRCVPEPIERSTFVLITCVILVLLFWQWRSFPGVIWRLEGAAAIALQVLFFTGFGIVLLSTFLIDHFHLFGIRQTLVHALGRRTSDPVFVDLTRRLSLPLQSRYFSRPSAKQEDKGGYARDH